MLLSLSGPIHKPISGGKPRQLVVLLHGLGADGNDLIALAPYWGRLLPEAEFISPDAPFPCDMAPFGKYCHKGGIYYRDLAKKHQRGIVRNEILHKRYCIRVSRF